jgi:hypothetical protein
MPALSPRSQTLAAVDALPIPAALPKAYVITVGLLFMATWALSHSYLGIFHDAGLYTLQSLAHLHPGSLTKDVFLKFGSQDRFSLFSPMYAAASGWLGVEPAAALLTLFFQVALLAGGWTLARAMMPASLAFLGVAVLIAVPGGYGAERIFTCIEPFLTPRMAAEALVLGALAAALSERRPLTIALMMLAAVLLHPIMAMAGVCAMICLYAGIRQPLVTVALTIVGIGALVLAAFVMPLGEWGRFDATWFALVKNRSPYLFLADWKLDDWSRVAVTLATFAVALSAPISGRARTLCLIALASVVSGLLLTLVACDVLHLALVTQLQPWRWQWLGTVVAALLLPYILHARWHEGRAARATVLLLVAAWVFAVDGYAVAAAAAALLSLAGAHRLKPSESRWVYWGAYGMLGIAIVWRVASNLQFTDAHYMDPHIPWWIRRTMSFAHDGGAPMALMTLAYWLSRTRLGGPALIALAAFAAGLCAVLLPQTWRTWTNVQYSAQDVVRFARFREIIPGGAEVFWPESTVSNWILLERPSYISVIQTSGLVFSRRNALELDRRASALGAAISRDSFMSWNAGGTGMTLSIQQLRQACSTGEFEFLVTGADLGLEQLAAVDSATGPVSKKLRLYRCQANLGPDKSGLFGTAPIESAARHS